jgi:hypothetical protein
VSSSAGGGEPHPSSAWIGAALLLLGLAAVAALWTPREQPDWVPVFLKAYVAAWACYVIAAVMVTRSSRLPRWALLWIVLAAFAMRLVALETRVPLTTDYWRYLWDGRVQNEGIDPFRYPPDAPELAHLRDKNWTQIWHKEISTIYPPAAELLFAGVARFDSSDPELLRRVFVAFEMGSILLLVSLLRRTGRRAERVIWYAWCPLPVTETIIGAHVDGFGLFLLLLAFWLAARRGSNVGALSAAALAASALAKGFTLLALPFLVKRAGWRSLLWFGAACVLLLLPYAGAGRRLFGGLSEYMAHWETNSSIFFLMDWYLTPVTEYHFTIARGVTTVGVLAFAAWLVWRQQPGMEWLMATTFAVLTAQLLLSAPTMPWYAVCVVPMLCWWAVPGLVLFTLTLSLQYYARWLSPGDVPLHHLLLWLGYLPVYALLIVHCVSWRVRGNRAPRADTGM